MPDDNAQAPDLTDFSDMLKRPMEIPQIPASPNPNLQVPTTQGRVPNVVKFIQQMANPTASVQPGDTAPRPPSRLAAFESFLGNFLQSFSAGMAGQGSGPGADMRGFGIAANAPYQNDLQQYQLQQQARAQQSLEEERKSNADYRKAQIDIMGKQITLPNGLTVPLALAEKIFPQLVSAQSRENVANIAQTGANQRTEATNASREKIASQNLAVKQAQFQTTDDYRKWKTKFDADNRMRIAQMNKAATQDKAPAAMFTSAVFARGGLQTLQDARGAMDELEKAGVLGSLPANKVENWIFGKGLVDPSLSPQVRSAIGKLRAAAELTSSATMRAHTGRTSREIYDDFKQMLGPGQDWSALRGAMDETQSLLTDYALAPSDENIRSMREGRLGGGSSAPPSGAKVRDYTDLGKK